MAEGYLTDRMKLTQIQDPVAAGTDDTTDTSNVDMAGFDGVVFIVGIGAVTATGTLVVTAQQAATDIAGDALADATATLTDADSNTTCMIDILHPDDRYVGLDLTRATANVVINNAFALQYKARDLPVTQGTLGATLVQALRPAEA